MSDEMVNKVLQEVLKRVGTTPAAADESAPVETPCVSSLARLTEYVGSTPVGDTEGIVIANLDPQIHALFGFDPKYRSIGVIGGRTGAGPQLMACDDAVKATNTEVLCIEMPRDTKGGAGHGNLIILGAEDVSDARRAVEVALSLTPKYFGDVYGNDAGYTENQYTARASKVLNAAFGVPEGKAFGLILGAPAVVGTVMIDTAVKAADVKVLGLGTPKRNTSFSNEVFIWITGDSGAVRHAVIAGREVGNQLLGAWGQEAKTSGTPYI